MAYTHISEWGVRYVGWQRRVLAVYYNVKYFILHRKFVVLLVVGKYNFFTLLLLHCKVVIDRSIENCVIIQCVNVTLVL